MSNTPHSLSIAYLLRLWPADDQMGTVWRAHLENPHTGERHGFSTLADLVAFLEAETGEKVLETENEGEETAVPPSRSDASPFSL